jgi:hypothetical protein
MCLSLCVLVGILQWDAIEILDVFSERRPRPPELGRNCLGLALMDVRAELVSRTAILAEWRLIHAKLQAGIESSTRTFLSFLLALLYVCVLRAQ